MSLQPFPDRQAAGKQLAAVLLAYRDVAPLVLGIPRGGVPVAAEVARRLGAELDVVTTRKLGAPAEPELAIGAVTADGGIYVDEETVARNEVTSEQLADVIARESAEARALEERFRGARPPRAIAGRTVIVVDDGLAMGSTMRATLRGLRARQPARLIAAVPVGMRDTCDELQNDADEVVCLVTPESMSTVGAFYDDFQQVADETVHQILRDFASDGSVQPRFSPDQAAMTKEPSP